MTGTIQHPQPPGKPFHGATLLDRLRADCIKAGVAGREEAEAECSRLEARLRVKQDRLAVLENHQHDPDAAKRVVADILRENQPDAARRTHELVWSRIGDDNAAPAPAAAKPRRRKRRASVTALIKHARKAGERGPVRVELPDGTAITTNSEPVATKPDDEGNEWDTVQ
jgi:hypothetical protein